MTKQKAAFSLLNKIDDTYACNKEADKMLIHTGTIGWALSSAAQIFGIMINDKIPKEQKMFLIPQEFMDACVNILAFYTITNTLSLRNYRLFRAGIGVIAMTIGSVISCNIITPLIRNKYASRRQQQNIEKMNNPNPAWQNPKTPREMTRAAIHQTYMQVFMNRGNLKV